MFKFGRIVRIFLLIVVLALLVVPALVVSASTGQPAARAQVSPPMEISEFLKWLISGGCIVAVSWLFEKMGWFQALSSDNKRYVIFGAAAVIGVAAWAVLTYVPAAILTTIAPVFAIVAMIFFNVLVAETFHKVDKA